MHINSGLYDIVGNILEWTASCHHLTYAGVSATGHIWEDGDCSYRSVRASLSAQLP